MPTSESRQACQRFRVVGGLDVFVVALRQAVVVDVPVAVDRQGDAQQFRRFGPVFGGGDMG